METKIPLDICSGCHTLFSDFRLEGLCPACSNALKDISSALSEFVEVIKLSQTADGAHVM